MKSNLYSRATLFLSACAAVIAVAALAVSYAQSGNTIQGCYDNKDGTLRRVTDPSQCTHKETPISWNITGPAGPQGPAGVDAMPLHDHHKEITASLPNGVDFLRRTHRLQLTWRSRE
jgi:hypothetical protein